MGIHVILTSVTFYQNNHYLRKKYLNNSKQKYIFYNKGDTCLCIYDHRITVQTKGFIQNLRGITRALTIYRCADIIGQYVLLVGKSVSAFITANL